MIDSSLQQGLTTPGGDAIYKDGKEKFNIRLKDPKEGILIQQSMIETLEIDENMFSLLPTFKLVINDKGTFFNGINLKNGDKIFFQITPNIDLQGDDLVPYIDAEYCIQSINCIPNIGQGSYHYTIVGIYNSQNYLNEVAQYPKTNDFSVFERDEYRSDEAIQEVLDDTSLNFVRHCEFNDTSLWVNCNSTRAEFIDKIIDHAWIDIDDAPILYTDLNGQAHYSSIKTIAKQKNIAKFENNKYHSDKTNKADGDAAEPVLLYDDVDILNAAGPILNQGGYTVKEFYYNPYCLTDLNDDDIVISDVDFNEIITDLLTSVSDMSMIDLINAQIMALITMGKYRTSTYTQEENYVASRSNKDAAQLERITKFVNARYTF